MPKNKPKLTETQDKVMHVLRKYGPMTDEQLVRKMTAYPGSTVRTRRAELVGLNKVAAQGERVNARGRHVTVWKAAYSRSK